MSYVDVNTPVIEKITLPSGNTYFIADREIRDVVDALSQAIAGGVSYIIAWDGTSTPVVANIPAGVQVTYNETTYTGTLAANSATPGAFYLVKSSTQAGSSLDVYDEYVPVGSTGSKSWEKIGDTQLDLSDVVTNVTLTKTTDTVIGTDATFTITQPTVALSTGATAGDGVISVATGITSASASGDNVTALTGLGSPSTKSAIGASSTFSVTQPTVAIATDTTSGTGKVQVATGISSVSASGDSVTALTGLGTPTTSNVASSVTPTTKKLATTTITGISGSSTPDVVKTRSTQTTAKGTGTSSSTNTDWLKGVSVSNGTLTFGAATMDTQTTYSADAPSAITIPIAAQSETTVATGAVTTGGSGADVVTDVAVGDTVAAVTGYASPTTDTVLGTGSTITVTPSTTYIKATASGAGVAWDSKDTVTAVTGYASPTTDTVLGSGSTITVTPTTTNIKATASGANTAWNNKDSVTVLTSTTNINVTKGGSSVATPPAQSVD